MRIIFIVLGLVMSAEAIKVRKQESELAQADMVSGLYNWMTTPTLLSKCDQGAANEAKDKDGKPVCIPHSNHCNKFGCAPYGWYHGG